VLKHIKYGFTLIELMIVVAIVGVLTAIAIPKFGEMLEKSREGATKGNIGAILSSIVIYSADNASSWPGDIDALEYRKYLDTIPPVKVTHPYTGFRMSGNSNVVELVAPGNTTPPAFAENTDGWRYDPNTGRVWVNNSQTDTKGYFYTNYGYD
jgi:prepilin-type N-terminal cleavage/methylation domain-containing protein